MMPESLLRTIRTHIRNTLDPLLAGHSQCALLDFPNHPNVGDSAIWLGEIAYLQQLGCRPRYICTKEDYSPLSLRQTIGNGIILINGGGNFGDLWPEHQDFREQVIGDFPDNPIIQLPQSIHFGNPERVSRARAAISAHKDFHLLVRDLPSLELARIHLDVSAHLCPDMAHMIDLQEFPQEASTRPIMILARSDSEQAEPGERDSLKTAANETHVSDWLSEPRMKQEARYDWVQERLRKANFLTSRLLNNLALRLTHSLASRRVTRGLRFLGQGSVIITDRLHASLLGRMLGRRVYYVDNCYGKLTSYVQTWLQDDNDLIESRSLAAALEQAHSEKADNRIN